MSRASAGQALADIARARQRAGADWPNLADIERNVRPTTSEEWAGLARMAAARLAAGQHLTALDTEALARTNRSAA